MEFWERMGFDPRSPTTTKCEHLMLMEIGTMPMTRTRVDEDGNVMTAEIRADDHGNGKLHLAVDADIEVGDIVEYKLPNGKSRTMKIVKHDVMQAPGGMRMGSDLDHTVCEYEVVNAKPLRQPKRVNIPGLHESISNASGAQFADGHYDDAVFNAFKAVEDRVKSLTGSEQSGKPLMATVFSEQNPKLDITSLRAEGQQEHGEAEGYKFLFMGASLGLRNPRGHGGNLQTDEQEAMEMLAFASLLMRSLDRAELRQAGREQRRMRGDLNPPIPPGLASRGGSRLK
jgi:uncharacterized protein (TIGR02391 family)